MIVITSLHNGSYTTLADITWANKVKYAVKHGYNHLAKTEDFHGYTPGFEKIQLILDIFENFSDTEWVVWTGTDSIITNHQIRVQDRICDTHDVIMAGDFNYAINADVILARNTPAAKRYFQTIMDRYADYKDHQFQEQQCMLDIHDSFTDVVKLVPQREINSYQYDIYTHGPWYNQTYTDVAGNDGNWQTGDWIIHWPGTDLNTRMQLAQKYTQLVKED
jgi:hypothetical protein